MAAASVRRSDAARPHSCDLRLNRLSESAATFFVTKSLIPKKPALEKSARQIVISALEFAVREKRIYLRAFVVMPDHWHALFALCEPWTLPKFMHAMMSFVAGKTSTFLKFYRTSWQEGYYDTRVKTPKQLAFVVNYIEQNPVGKSLGQNPREWDASSATRTDLIEHPWPWLFH